MVEHAKCIHELFEAQADATPNAIAVVFEGQQLTYRELDERATRLACELRRLGVAAETPVTICANRSLEMVAGVLGILKAGGCYVPLDPAYPAERLAWMIDDTAAPVLLTEKSLLPSLPQHEAKVVLLDEPLVFETGPKIPPVSSDQLANVLYTSGSTGRPKGIAMSHRSLIKVIEWQARRLQCRRGTRTAQFASLSFDVSFLEMFSMLCTGGTVVLLSEGVRQDPASLWNCLIEEQIEILFVPFVGLQQLAQVALNTETRPQHLREIASSGEQLYITPAVVRLFEILETTALDNLYGPTESHAAMEFRLEGPPAEWPKRPPIGRSIDHSEIYLLDEDLNLISPGVDGEIYIGGHGLARGYLHRPDLTAERFLPDPFSKVPGARMYRTGDSARYLPNGVLEFTGRIDHQLKIRGFRVEPEEVEAELNRHAAIRNAVVVGWSNGNGEKRLAAYFVAEEGSSVSTPALRRYLESKLPEYMVPSVFIPLEDLPLSPNGKLDRRALPLPAQLSRALDTEFVAPRNELEKQLAAVWTDVLGLDEIGVNDNFFELGGHSLLAATLLTRLREAVGSTLTMRRLFESPTVAELAQAISEENTLVTSEELPELTPDLLNWNEPFPLADMQQAYWIGRSGAFELGQVATHLYLEIESTTVSVERLETVIQKLVQRHPMLRAVILPDGQQQVLASPPPYKLRALDLQHLDASEAKRQLDVVRQEMSHQVMPAHEWPWFEVRASRLGDGRVLFHVSYDLLIGDLGSLQILISELTVLLQNPEAALPELTVSFRDYVLAEAALQELPAFKAAKTYWMERLATMPPPPELPLARHPSAIMEQRFVRRSGRLDPDTWQKLQARARQYNVTPTVVLLTAYAEIVNAWSTSSRFTINLPIQNRLPLHPQIKEIVGEFSSLSLLAVDNSTPASFAARAQVVQKQLWEDLSHRHYSGTRVMREWSRRYSGTSSAVMPVVFTSALNLELSGWITGAAEQVVYSTLQTPQVWLDNQVGEHGGALNFNWDAVDGLFPAGMFDGMFDAYCRLLNRLAEQDETWSRLDLEIAPAVPAELSVAPVSQSLLHELFLDQARRTPQRPAVITAERELTYGELDQLSDAIASRLRIVHTGKSKLVAIVMDKGWEQIAAALGILRAGLAYVPIDPQLPESRRFGLLKDADVEVILTQPWAVQSLAWPEHTSVLPVRADDLSDAWEKVDQSSTDLAYVIYTSGSTGFPKGVMIDHRGAVNTILDINSRFNVTASDRVLGLSSLSFDLSVYDIFGTLAAGGAIVLPAPEQTRDPSSWVELIERFDVTIWDAVPALMEMLVEYLEHSERITNKLRLVMMSGDWIPVNLPQRIGNLFPEAELFSLGGATEASIWSILHRIEDEDSSLPSVPYGRSMTNQSVQVLNETLQPCPVWVAGELFIGGVGVALGYLNDEEKTRASFITHPNGERLYRTGDIGRYLPNGEIEFLGRRDLQVKVQGFRIELGEIEATLLQHELVRSAVVAVAGETSFEKRLVAFIVVENGSTVDEIKEFLRSRLAPHMVPAEFHVVDEIPITSNGKVDRKALFARIAADRKPDVTPTFALTDTEKALASVFSELLGIEHVDTHVNLFDLGVTSLHIVRAHNRLRTMLADPVPIVQFFKYPTIKSLAANLKQARRLPDGFAGTAAAHDDSPARDLGQSGDIAVIGMSCRFPGARNVNEFLRNLRNGVESMSRFSDEELLESGISPQLLRRPDYVKAGSVLEGIDEFDAGFFGISPREAEITDPQQRIFLEIAWEALEDAGCDPQQYGGSIGVFAGANLSTYLLCNFNARAANTIPGVPLTLANDKDYLATRVSYKLNLRGPSMTVQTACSTSLVAIHIACRNLLSGDCDLALAGGITINVPHKSGYQYQAGGLASPDGRCRPFDAHAQGTVFGNGAGVVVLKRLEDAKRDNDRIVAVIKGSAINNDGAGKVGFTAPSVDGQTEVIAKALKRAGVQPGTIGYVETHGTGTLLGDPIEIEALSQAFSPAELRPSSCAIGSVKSNLGHLDSAAGVAGFIKTALSLQHAELFPSLNYSTPNPQIEFGRTPFYVNTELRSWFVSNEAEKRRAGVSSFGLGGTNAHVVVEEWRESVEEVAFDRGDETYVLPLSARDGAALRELAARYVEQLRQSESPCELRDLSYSASVRRAHHRERVAVVGKTAAELRAQLEAFLRDEPAPGVFSGRAASELDVVYVFPGQGAQWWGMGRELAARYPEYRASLSECDELFRQRTQEWRLLEELERGPEESRLDGEQIDLTQCALFALQVSLARLWSSFGVQPAAVVGHSMGEVAAAVAAGVLSLAEGVEVIYERSRLLREASGHGAMVAVELGEAEAEAAVAGGLVSVAAVNGKRASVVSGEREAVARLIGELEERGVMVRELHIKGLAAHSPQVAGISEELVRVLGRLRGRNSEVRMISTVLGRAVAGEEVDASYWGRNVREQVRFRAAMQEAARSGEAVYIEMNAHPALGLWIREAVEETQGKPATVVAALRRERSEQEVTLTGLAELYAAGVAVNWEALWRGRAARYVSLPTYPWQRRRYWVDESNIQSQPIATADFSQHPLLGKRITSPLLDDFVFESQFNVSANDLLNDHRVYGVPVVPATIYVELALAAATEAFREKAVSIHDFVIQGPMILPESDSRTVQVVIGTEREGMSSFRIFSRASGGDKWSLHASGSLRLSKTNLPHEHFPLVSLQSRIVEPVPVEVFAARTRSGNVEYGPAFQGIKGVWSGNNEALGYIELAEATDAYSFHPALLDLCFQIVEAVRTGDSVGDFYLPLSVERLRCFAQPGQAVWCYAYIRPEDNSETLAADVVIFDEKGSVIAEVEELRFKRATKESLLRGWHGNIDDWFYEVDWKPSKIADIDSADATGRWLIVTERADFAAELSGLLKNRGGEPTVVTSAEHVTELINRDAGSILRGIVYLWRTSSLPDENTSSNMMMNSLRTCCERVLHLVRDVVAAGANDVPRLTIVTRGAQQPASPSSLVQSSLWGLGRTIALEHPELNVSLIDLPDAASVDDARRVMDELFRPGDQVSFRNGERHVARLTHRRQIELPEPISLREDATYLITGAFGGIGPKLIRWMFENGARHFVLIGRSGPSAEARILLDELESQGAKVLVGQADVTDVEQLAGVLENAASQMPPLRGVVHAALVLDDGVLLQLEWESFRRVLAPKAAGAWNLHLLTREAPLDFFVCFSSVLALLGGSGQANYAAASTFVDALAHYRRAAGLPGLSINWGPWSFAGSASLEVIEQHSQLYDGFTSIPVESGFDVFGRLLSTTQPQIGVMPFDAAQWGELYPAVGATFLADVISEERSKSTRSRKEVPTLTSAALLKAEPSERQRLLGDYLQGIIARRLGLSAASLDVTSTFINLGLDSLMMLEIRNRIVDDLGLIIPPVKFIENPSVAQLTTAAYERWLEVNGPTEIESDFEELRSRLPLLSDEEVESSLRSLLATAN